MRGARWMVVALAMLALPLPADAQVGASIAGVIKDAQGAVMPGVTVEAASPVLIEKVRSAVSDGTGRFEIPNLRPGVYTVTFTLTGFSTVKREGIELTGTAVVAVDAEMRIGAVTETITVSGETPIVDVQSTRRQTVMDEAVVTAIPTSRNGFAVSVLIPGVVLATGGNANQDVGGALGPTTLSIAAHGSRLHDQKLTVNGVSLSTMIGGGWGGGAVPNATGTSEFAIDTAAVDATLATGGPRINFIPKDGGNRVSGTIFGSFANAGMQSNSTRTEGVTGPLPTPLRADTVKTNADFNPGVGGPFVRDKVWFYFSGRFQKADVYVPGMFHNQAANDPSVFVYVPDTSRPATGPREFQVYQGRVTYQANPRNKFGVTYDLESNCFCPDTTPGGVSATRTPESGTDRRFPLQRFVQLDWNSPLSSKILLEASGIHRVERWGAMHLQTGSGDNIESLNPAMVGISDTGLAPPPGFIYRAATGGAGNVPPYNNSWNVNVHYRAALSYITGSHAFKVGFNNAWGHHENSVYGVQPYFYNFLNGKPTGLTVQATPYTDEIDVDRDLGIFAQDKWTTGKWTLSGGIRYDNFKNSFPAQELVAGPLVPKRAASYPHIDNINWHDVTPKMGASYDLFGNGKTALKVTLNKYLMGYGTNGFFENGLSSRLNPILRLVTNTTRSWNDSFYGASDPRTANFTPDCPAGLAGPPSGECGPLANPNFGTLNQALVDPGPQLLEGWGKRQYNWEFSTGVQHEILPRVSLDVSYFRRWYGNFQVEDDLSVTPADYDRFNFVVPTDKNLPGGGGYTLTAYDLKAGRPPEKNRLTLSDEYGKMIDHWNGVDVVVNARLQNGFVIQGGVSTGRRVADNCDIIDDLPELEQTLYGPNATPPLGGTNTRVFVFGATPINFCHRDERFLTQMKALGAYTIPKIEVQFAGTFQSLPGPIIEANYNNFSTGTLGRPYGTGPFRAFQIVEPGALFGERLNEFDFRISKIFKVGRTRTNINFDLYNLFNADTALTENFAYGAPWRRPTSILQSRFFKFGVQFDF